MSLLCWLSWACLAPWIGSPQADEADLIEPVRPYLRALAGTFEQIPAERRKYLDSLAQYVEQRRAGGRPVQLVFICTHNSRRSQFAQVWCQVAAAYYRLPEITAFSGGTEATACNPRTIHALRRAGLSAVATTGGANPVYLIQYSDAAEPIRVYSKVFDGQENPHRDFAALVCCADADERCPLVAGAEARFALHYADPKVADGTPAEAERYDERCREIAREMLYVMAQVAAAEPPRPARQ